MKPILITGATGFLGKHLVQQLRQSGEGPLRLLCRGATVWDADPGVEVVRGDITSSADVDRAVNGVRSIYHLAGFVSRNPKDRARLFEVHVGGTRNVCDAALRHSVDKVVAASSSGTIAVSKEPVIHDEESGYKTSVAARWQYYLSKIAAEQAVLDYHARDGLPVVVVNPALLLGPGDDHGSSTGDVKLFLDGQILSMPSGGMSFVDARDCAAGCIAAMRRGRPGERYLLGGVNWTFRQVIEAVAQIAARRAPRFGLPVSISLTAAPLLRRLMPLAGRRFDLDDTTIEMASYFWYCDSTKAKNEIGFCHRDPMETLRDTVTDLLRK